MKSITTLIHATLLLLCSVSLLKAQNEVTYGFLQGSGCPAEMTAVAYPNYTSNNVTISTAVFTFLLPEGTATDPAVLPLPAAGTFNNITGVWTVQLLTEDLYDMFTGSTDGLGGNDVYQVVLQNSPEPVAMMGVPIQLFSFALPSDCMGGNIEVLTNDSQIQQDILAAFGANFNNQMSMSVNDAPSEDIYAGNDPATFSYSCPLLETFNPVDDNAETCEDFPVNIDVLSNDEGLVCIDEMSSVTITVNASNGMATIDDGGTPDDPLDDTIDYTPNAGFTGTETIEYEICDNNGVCDQATITITVYDGPTVNPEDEMVIIGSSVEISGNATAGDGAIVSHSWTISDPGTTGITTANLSNEDTENLTVDATGLTSGEVTFSYTIVDANGCTATGTSTLMVGDTPDAVDDTATTTEDAPVNIDVLDNDDFGADGPAIGPITVTVDPINGTAVVNDGGTPDDPTDDTIDYTPNPGFTGVDVFTYEICDSNGDCDQAMVTVTVLDPEIAIVKSGTWQDANMDGFAQVGEMITYAFTVTNTGEVDLTNVTVTDPLVTVMGGPIPLLSIGASDNMTFTATYAITQADIDAGGVTNQATATGTDPNGNPTTDISDDNDPLEDDPTVTPLPINPSIAIVKSGTFQDEDGDGLAQVGETISYAFTVSNTGNVTLTNVTVTDPLVTVSGGPIATFPVGASDATTFTATYVITQADIDAGGVTNQATATGTDPNGDPTTDISDDNDPLEDDPTVTPLPINPSIAIVKSGTFQDEDGDGFAQVGETISYAFTVSNTGNVTLTNVTVTDPLVTVSGGPIATFAVGASDNTTFTATYVITQADIDAGGVTNQATATGTDPNGDPTTDISDDNDPLEDDPTVTPLPINPSIAIVKSGTFQDESGDGFAQVGETISYAFTVSNTGNVTLTNVTVTDPLVTVSGGPIATFAVGASDNTTFTATYVITQADIDAGGVTNQATATGTDPNGDPTTDISDDNDPLEDDPTVTPLPINPSIAIVKSGTFQDEDGDGLAQVGETISYAFTVSNTGNVTLTNVTVTDPLVTVSGGPIATFAVGASDATTFTATYVITQADIDAGGVTNQATATGTDPNGDPTTDISDDNDPLEDDPTVTPLPINPSIAIVKSGTFQDEDGDGLAQVGETISYAFTVSNTGNVTLTNVTVTDPLVTVSGGPIATFAVGASDNTTFTATYVITQADIDAGGVTNQATATGTDPNGDPTTDISDDNDPLEDDPTVTPLPINPSIAIVKSGTFQDEDGDGLAQVGETISYAFTVSNTGNVTLTNVTVTDPLVTVSGGPIATFAVGASDNTTFTATYVITQADIDAGGVTNQATATGTDPNGDPTTDISDDNDPLEDDPTVTPLPINPSIAIVKSGTFQDEDGDGLAQVGETISYAFTVSNTGNVTLTNVTVTDPLVTVSGGPIATFAVGASDNTTFTATYVITQADIDAGGVTNQATATGTDPNGDPTTDISDDNDPLEDDPTVTPLPQNPGIAIVKSGTFQDEDGDGFAQVGETISYAFTVSNTGNVTLTNVTVTDPLVTVSGGPIATFAVGASDNTTFTATYVITQADIDAGGVTNQATATGTDPNGDPTTDISDDNDPLEDDPTVTPLPQNPGIAIVKSGTFQDEDGDGLAQVGETISYAFTVSNTGNVTLTNVTVTDPLVTVSGGPIATFAVGASDATTFTATYVITQADIDAGGVTNQATATGTDPNGDPTTDISDDNDPLEDDPTVTPLPQNPGIAIVKSGTFQDEDGDGLAQVGETISYAFTVSNTGNVTLTNVTVTDPLVTVSGGPIATFAVGASDNTTFTATYVITQADIDAGGVTNQATATGTDPNGDPTTDISDDNDPLEDDPTVTPLPQNPGIAIVKSGTFQDEDGDGLAQVGETISYAFTVSNTGNVTLTNVTVTDPLVTVSGGPIATFAVGASDNTTFTATYVITQADIDAGGVTNQATATGTDPNGDPTTDISDDNDPLEDDPTVTPLPQNPGIAIVKSGTFQDEDGDGFAQVGETISYAFTVSNTGNVTLTNVTVTDPLVTVSGGPIATFAVGASDNTTFTATYVITQADIDAGGVTNQATATGTDPNGDPTTDISDDNDPLEDDPTVTPLPHNPGIAIVKSGTFQDESGDGLAQVGETISYTFTVSNTGNVTLTNVTVTDPLVTVSGGPIATFAVGASDNTTFTATYVITQADIDAGGVTNQATATGTDPNGDPTTDISDDNDPLEDDPTVTPLPFNPGIAIVKSGTFQDEDGDGFAQVGETISYAFTVSNTGNVTLTNVTVTDPLVTVSGGPIATFAVGASDNTTFTATYVITQADIDAGGVTNQATATGTDPNGDPTTDISDDNDPLEDDPTVTPLPQNPGIAIVKSGTFQDEDGDGFAQVGETISYAFTVSNTGNVTLTNVTVTDPLVTVSGGPIATFAVGASDATTFTATYVITQADIDAGGVTNQATATGTDPNGDPTTDISDDNDPLEDDPTVTPLPQNPGIAIVKSGTFQDEDGDGFAQVGETISYAFTVSNTGNVTLTNVTVTDPLVTVSGGPIATFPVGASDATTFTATYVITQADIDAGGVTNQATATGTDPNGDPTTDISDDNDPLEDDPTVTPLPQNPGIAIVKSGTFQDEDGDGFAQVGETISYAFTVTNTGNVTLTNVTVTDPLVTVMGGPLATLAVGASDNTTFTASYVITQADIDAGGVTNQATATGTDPNGDPTTDISDDNDPLEDDPTVTPLPQNPGIAIVKSGTFQDEDGDGFAQVGETISYAFTVSNTGNVTLTNVTVTDPLVTVMGGPLATLAVGASDNTTFTATYVITQADIDAGGVTNQATATGTDPNGDPTTDISDDNDPLEDDPTVTPLPQNPGIAIVKSGTFQDEDGDGLAQVGETISYAFTVSNTGNVTLTNVTVTDPLVTVSGGPIATFPVGASDATTFTATYVITQADIDAGGVTNQATATGTDPNGDPTTDISDDNDPLEDDPTVTPLPQNPGIAIVKSGTFQDEDGDGLAQVGETISYAFTVSNTGNVTLTNVTVTDPLVTVSGGPIATFPVGASDATTFTATYVITQADIDAGGVTNQATATGTDPNGDPTTDISDDNDPLEDDPTVTPLPQNPGIAIVKSGTFQDEDGDGLAQVGETISYAFTVSNTGNVTLTNVTVTDPLVTVMGGPLATLAVGASDNTTFTASYVITQADIDAGGVTNQATATGTDPNGDPTTDISDDNDPLEDDPTVTPLPQNPGIAIVKTGTFQDESGDGFAQVGETISYAFAVTNTGNVTLTNVTVTDPLVTVMGGPLATLAVGASDNTTFTASYVITQADIDAGGVTNQATATGTDPNGDPTTDISDDNDPLEDDPTVTPLPPPTLKLSLRVQLQGALLGSVDGMMRDDLRTSGHLPTAEPYSAIPSYTHVNNDTDETVGDPMTVFGDNGVNSIIDWVFVEIRSAVDPAEVLATRSGLLQKDGDVVDLDGVSPLCFEQSEPAAYYVAVRHRNHLGTMTADAIDLSVSGTIVDFIDPNTDLWQNSPAFDGIEQITVDGQYALWAGNTNANKSVIFAGQQNDKDPIFNEIDQASGNILGLQTFILPGYFLGDVNMDGNSIFAGQNNDVDPIFNNVDGHLRNLLRLQTYVIPEQLAE